MTPAEGYCNVAGGISQLLAGRIPGSLAQTQRIRR